MARRGAVDCEDGACGGADAAGAGRRRGAERDLAARERALRGTREALLLDMELDALARARWRAAQTPAEWAEVETAHPTRPKRTKVTLLLDAGVAGWFRAQGHGYQARINAVLRAYMAMKAVERVEEKTRG